MNDYVILEGRNKAVHMVGDWVGVCWRTHEVKRVIEQGGIEYSARITEIANKTEANIQFIAIRQDELTGVWYEDDDNYATDWHDPKTARIMAAELIAAAEYVDALLEKE